MDGRKRKNRKRMGRRWWRWRETRVEFIPIFFHPLLSIFTLLFTLCTLNIHSFTSSFIHSVFVVTWLEPTSFLVHRGHSPDAHFFLPLAFAKIATLSLSTYLSHYLSTLICIHSHFERFTQFKIKMEGEDTHTMVLYPNYLTIVDVSVRDGLDPLNPRPIVVFSFLQSHPSSTAENLHSCWQEPPLRPVSSGQPWTAHSVNDIQSLCPVKGKIWRRKSMNDLRIIGYMKEGSKLRLVGKSEKEVLKKRLFSEKRWNDTIRTSSQCNWKRTPQISAHELHVKVTLSDNNKKTTIRRNEYENMRFTLL